MSPTVQLRIQALIAAAVALIAATAFTMRDDDAIRIRGTLAPTAGPNSLGHIRGKSAYLARIAAASPDRAAAGLVSFSRPAPAAEVARLTEGMEVTAAFVKFPQGEPDTLLVERPLTEAVAERAREVGDVIRAEIVSLDAQLREAQEPEREQIEASIDSRRQALADSGPDCACVYAVAVEATTLAALHRLQQRDEVLLVDVPDPVVDDLAGWELRPVLPAVPS